MHRLLRPLGQTDIVRRTALAIIIGGCLGSGVNPALAGDREVRAYNRDFQYEMKVEGNRVDAYNMAKINRALKRKERKNP